MERTVNDTSNCNKEGITHYKFNNIYPVSRIQNTSKDIKYFKDFDIFSFKGIDEINSNNISEHYIKVMFSNASILSLSSCTKESIDTYDIIEKKGFRYALLKQKKDINPFIGGRIFFLGDTVVTYGLYNPDSALAISYVSIRTKNVHKIYYMRKFNTYCQEFDPYCFRKIISDKNKLASIYEMEYKKYNNIIWAVGRKINLITNEETAINKKTPLEELQFWSLYSP